jgi:hypothetical protein
MTFIFFSDYITSFPWVLKITLEQYHWQGFCYSHYAMISTSKIVIKIFGYFPLCPGVTKIRPDDLEFPSTMTDIDHDSWMLSGTSVMQVSDA